MPLICCPFCHSDADALVCIALHGPRLSWRDLRMCASCFTPVLHTLALLYPRRLVTFRLLGGLR